MLRRGSDAGMSAHQHLPVSRNMAGARVALVLGAITALARRRGLQEAIDHFPVYV